MVTTLGKVTCAIIIHWGDDKPTVSAALAILETGLYSEVIVVANDGKPRPQSLNSVKVRWEIPDRNLGFAGGCQFGADSFPADKYAFFNADVSMDSQSMTRCLEALDLPGVGIAGPVLYHPDGRLQSACGTLSHVLWRPRVLTLPSANPTQCQWVTGAAFFCRGEVIEQVGWDGSYFLTGEDVDLCLRARYAQWQVVVVPRATGVHPGGSTLRYELTYYYYPRNRIWLTRRHRSVGRSILVTLILIGLTFRLAAADLIKRRRSGALIHLRGVLAGWQSMPHDKQAGTGEPIPARWIK